MFSRPKTGEDEDDILKLQEEFLRSKSQASVSVVNKRKTGTESKPNPVPENTQEISNKKFRSKFGTRRDHTKQDNNEQQNVGIGVNVLGEIQEKNVDVRTAVAPPTATSQCGFPEVFARDKELTGKGRSIFAQQIAKQRGVQHEDVEPPRKMQAKQQPLNHFGKKSFILSGPEASRIHTENVAKLSELSVGQIQEEQQKWTSQLDPKLLDFLKSRRQKQVKVCDNAAAAAACEQPPPEAVMEVDEPVKEEIREEQDAGSVGLPPLVKEANKWLHMDVVEWEKLKWMGDITPAQPVPPDQPYAARFDFQGLLLPYTEEEIDVTGSLYHHGTEPERPGYSLEELFQMTRSTVLQQRVLGLTTIANILEKTKIGHYDECFQETLVGRLLDSEVFLLLRFSLDDNTETILTASLIAMRNLLVSQPDEVCLDRALGCVGGIHQPSLSVVQEVKPGMEEEAKDEEAELRDHETLRLDVVKGALRTDLIPRLRYILETLKPGPKAVIAILEILTRLVRHSHDTTLAVTCCPRLLNTIITHFVPRDWRSIVGGERPEEMTSVYDVPLVEALRLLRIIACRSRTLATNLVHKHGIMTSVVSYISVDPRECSLPHQEALRLSLESLYLWHTLLAYNLATQQFTDLYPIFMQLLQFHLSATAVTDTNTIFGHEHGTALVSLLEQAVQTAYAQDTKSASGNWSFPRTLSFDHVRGFVQPLEMCLTKWLVQLSAAPELTFSSQKLLGATLNCLARCYSCHRLQPSGDMVSHLEALERLCGTQLLNFLRSANFEHAAKAVKSSSCLLYHGTPGADRNPTQLPSLGALMWRGQQLTPVLSPSSSIPLLHGLVNFMIAAHTIHKGLSPQCIQAFMGNTALLDYLSRVAHQATACLSGHWFTRFEVTMLAAVLRLAQIENCHQTSLFHHLALKLVTLIQTDQKCLLKEVLSQVVFNPDFFKDCSLLSQDMAALQLHDSPLLSSASSRQTLLQEAVKNLPVIWKKSYETSLGLGGVQNTSPLDVISLSATERGAETALPVDWAYLPILYLHSYGLAGQSADEETTEKVVRALQWVMLLEWLRPAAISIVDFTDRFCRLATVFLAGSDLFLEPRIYALLAAGLAQLMNHNKKIKFPASFYDQYTELLEQFAAVSYGDALFGHFILVPLQQRQPVSLRKLVWSEQAAVLRVLSTSLQQLMFPLTELLEPCETEPSQLLAYLHCLATGTVREQWSPVLHVVALHHVATFIKLHQDTGLAQQIRTGINRLCNKVGLFLFYFTAKKEIEYQPKLIAEHNIL